MNRSLRSLVPRLRPLVTSPQIRHHTTIPTLLSSLSATKPAKDAFKFSQPAPEKPSIFTYQELHKHTAALASGLEELSYSPSDRLLCLLNPSTPEYTILLLAASHLNLSVITLPLPTDPSKTSVKQLSEALHKYKPRALFVGKEFAPDTSQHEHDGILSAVHPLINAIAPHVVLSDAKGYTGFAPLTGRSFHSPHHPYLQHVVHTADDNFRACITFKSLLVYSGNVPNISASPDTPLWISVETGDQVSETALLQRAADLADEMHLSGDHSLKNGKLVVTPNVSRDAVAAVLAAVMKEALYVSPGEAEPANVALNENAVIM